MRLNILLPLAASLSLSSLPALSRSRLLVHYENAITRDDNLHEVLNNNGNIHENIESEELDGNEGLELDESDYDIDSYLTLIFDSSKNKWKNYKKKFKNRRKANNTLNRINAELLAEITEHNLEAIQNGFNQDRQNRFFLEAAKTIEDAINATFKSLRESRGKEIRNLHYQLRVPFWRAMHHSLDPYRLDLSHAKNTNILDFKSYPIV